MLRLSGIRLLVLFSVLVLASAWATPSGATLLTWTDNGIYAPSAGGLNPITYTLEFGAPNSGGVYEDAIFKIIVTEADPGPAYGEWRAGWVAFKFGPFGDSFALSNLDTVAPGGTWTIATASTTVPNGETPFDGQFVGFYSTDLNTGTPPGQSGGVLLTGGAAEYVFTFDFSGTGTVFTTDPMPFKVGFYDGLTGNSNTPLANRRTITDKLSEDLRVPEPSTLLLLGAGLLGLGIWGRRKFKS